MRVRRRLQVLLMRRLCRLRNGKWEQTEWLPTQVAKVGWKVPLVRGGKCEYGWEIVAVYDPAIGAA